MKVVGQGHNTDRRSRSVGRCGGRLAARLRLIHVPTEELHVIGECPTINELGVPEPNLPKQHVVVSLAAIS